MGINIKIAANSNEIEAVKNIRRKVFCIEQKIPEEIEFEDNKNVDIHFVVLYDNLIVGTARLTLLKNNVAKGSRLAVLREYRHLNLGKKLIMFIKDVAISLNLKKIIIEPHSYLENYYSYFGFKKIEGSYSFNEINLIKMEIVL